MTPTLTPSAGLEAVRAQSDAAGTTLAGDAELSRYIAALG